MEQFSDIDFYDSGNCQHRRIRWPVTERVLYVAGTELTAFITDSHRCTVSATVRVMASRTAV